MNRVLLDTGPLVALLDRRDTYHDWAKEQVAHIRPPMLTCEAVITEAFHLLRTLGEARLAILEMLGRKLLAVRFRLDEHHDRIKALLLRYGNVPMSLADACLVRLAETVSGSRLLTLDSDFRIYRLHGRQLIGLLIPPDR
jgi:predicted nucleic acid-binding protein